MILKTIRSFPMFCGLFPFSNPDTVDKKHSDRLSLYKVPDDETGWDRLSMMFSVDEFGSLSPEVSSIVQTTFMGAFLGACYGGFLFSRKAYLEFVERNQATAFTNHLEAKKLLQNHVTVNFGKGAFKWGWRVTAFTGSYLLITTVLQTYRGESRLVDYIFAGGVAGALYRFHLGIRGFLVGGLLGSALGTVAGGATMLLMRATGTSVQEVRYWQYKWKQSRDYAMRESAATGTDPDPLFKMHDDLQAKREEPAAAN